MPFLAAIPLGVAALIGGGAAAAGGVASALIGSGAAKSAATTQADAAVQAAQITAQQQQAALDFQKQVYNTNQTNAAPWIQAGTSAVNTLSQLMQNGTLTQPFDPNAFAKGFTGDPGYQFRLNQGLLALQRSAAARGVNATGGTQKAITDYAQNFASNEFNTAYNRSFNTFETNQTNAYNRYANLAGLGQNAVSTLGYQGNSAAGNIAGTYAQGSNLLSNLMTGGAAATAAGTVGAANALTGGITAGTSSLGNSLLLSSLMNSQNTSAYSPSGAPTPGGSLFAPYTGSAFPQTPTPTYNATSPAITPQYPNEYNSPVNIP